MKREKMIVVFMILAGFLIAPSLGLGQTHQHGTSPENAKAPSVKPSPQKEAAKEEVPTVEIPTDKQQLIGLRTTTVAVRPLQKIIRTSGRVEYDERKMATVNLKFEGWIEKLYINYTGSRVKKGEPLAEIYSPELLATQQEFLNALKWRDSKKEGFGALLAKDAEIILEAAKQRLRLWDISEEQIK